MPRSWDQFPEFPGWDASHFGKMSVKCKINAQLNIYKLKAHHKTITSIKEQYGPKTDREAL